MAKKPNNPYSDGFSYTGIDEHDVIQTGNVMSGTVTTFTKCRFDRGWKGLAVVNNAGVEVAAIFSLPNQEKPNLSVYGWWSDVA